MLLNLGAFQGFDDTEMNKELLAKNGGSIKRAVMDLIAREKKDK
jgi:next-to-BRCA1 protein 1